MYPIVSHFPGPRRSSWQSAAVLALAITFVAAQADIFEWLGLKKAKDADPAVGALGGTFTEGQLVVGLKEALDKGLKQAVANLGRPGGFLTNLSVKIPMPEKLQKAERLLRAVGQDRLAEDFVVSMNRAAERAVPEAAAVFGDAIQQMTIVDARNILTGPSDAATQFFARTTRTNLAQRFLPMVKKATEEVGVTATYKDMTARLAATDSLGGGLVGSLRNKVIDDRALDLDAYVNERALDGLFKMVAEEEKRIRENPAARTTELMQKVFGSLGR